MTARPRVFVDVEATGLDPTRHEIWEIAYAVDDGPILSSFVTHQRVTLDYETVAAARVNGYVDRCPPEWATLRTPDLLDSHQSDAFEDDLMGVLVDATLVAANPAFDAAMLRARWGGAPWHYRLLDVEAYAMGVLGWDEMHGLAAIAEALGIDQPDHTAATDVRVLRECFRRLQRLQVVFP